jgi:phosphatidylinositol alpha-1,6-mannosyltransferase
LKTEFPDLHVVIAGSGRDSQRLQALIDRLGAPAQLLGRVPDADLPTLYGAADVGAMLCRDRWFGLEQEGFGIVFLEAASCGTPQLAGRSGGSDEAVVDGETGVVVDQPSDPRAVAASLAELLRNAPLREQMSTNSRQRVLNEFTYDALSVRLADILSHPVGCR